MGQEMVAVGQFTLGQQAGVGIVHLLIEIRRGPGAVAVGQQIGGARGEPDAQDRQQRGPGQQTRD